MDATTEKYNTVKGQSLKKADVKAWTPEVFKDYFTLTDIFYFGGKIAVSRETALAAEQYQDASPLMFEILARIDHPTDTPNWDRRIFYMRLNTMMRIVKLTIKDFPDILTPLLVDTQRKKPQFAWMDEVYGDDNRIKPAELPPEEPVKQTGLAVLEPLAPAERLANAMGKVADLYYAIADSVTDEDIKALSPKDKINALNKLSYLHVNMKKIKFKVNFNKFNVQKGSKEEIEAALLDVDDSENEEE